jgi:hypothetical protein
MVTPLALSMPWHMMHVAVVRNPAQTLAEHTHGLQPSQHIVYTQKGYNMQDAELHHSSKLQCMRVLWQPTQVDSKSRALRAADLSRAYRLKSEESQRSRQHCQPHIPDSIARFESEPAHYMLARCQHLHTFSCKHQLALGCGCASMAPGQVQNQPNSEQH